MRILLVPGFAQTSSVWDRTVEHLPGEVEATALDVERAWLTPALLIAIPLSQRQCDDIAARFEIKADQDIAVRSYRSDAVAR